MTPHVDRGQGVGAGISSRSLAVVGGHPYSEGEAPMKRIALLCMGLALGAANAAEAQLTMQMSNGWSFTFAGNVNAFLIYQTAKTDAGVKLSKDLSFGTGLLPAFAVFDAKGKEENLDLGVHFGFAP